MWFVYWIVYKIGGPPAICVFYICVCVVVVVVVLWNVLPAICAYKNAIRSKDKM